MSEFKAVRLAGATEATPYLREWLPKMLEAGMSQHIRAVDLACGNGRNTRFLKQHRIQHVQSLDAKPDGMGVLYWTANQMIPAPNASVGLLLCQYLLMFLNDNELHHVLSEIHRVAAPKCVALFELQDVKQGCRRIDAVQTAGLFLRLAPGGTDWQCIHMTKMRCIYQRIA